jgi:CheY-like chemotaxis protein
MGIFSAAALLFMKDDSRGHLQDDEAESASEGPKGTVLAIDDDPSFLEAVQGLLSAEGFNVLTSSSGPKGLDTLRYASRDIRAVLLDYNMPGFDGAATLEFVRKLNPNVKVFAVTGVAKDLLPTTYREGVDRVLTKPFRNGELLEALNTGMAGNGQSPSPVAA